MFLRKRYDVFSKINLDDTDRNVTEIITMTMGARDKKTIGTLVPSAGIFKKTDDSKKKRPFVSLKTKASNEKRLV